MKFELLNTIFFAGFIAYISMRAVYEHRAKAKKAEGRYSDKMGLLLLIPVGVSGLPLPLIYLLTDLLAFADYAISSYFRWTGVIVMLIALWLFRRSHADLGQNWSATLQLKEDHKLVTFGVYRSIRHPMYSAIFLWDISQGMILQNWLAGWAALVAFSVLCIARVPKEERMMTWHFGNEYKEYMNRSGRIFPRMRGTRQVDPATLATSGEIFLNGD